MKYITLFILVFSSGVVIGKDKDVCKNPVTTHDMNVCKRVELKKVEAKLKKYYLTSLQQNEKDFKTVKLIKESQEAWIKYRKKHCSAIYQMWIDGTIRGAMYLACVEQLTRDRMYVLWRSYLTYMDSTPPILPKPKRQN